MCDIGIHHVKEMKIKGIRWLKDNRMTLSVVFERNEGHGDVEITAYIPDVENARKIVDQLPKAPIECIIK